MNSFTLTFNEPQVQAAAMIAIVTLDIINLTETYQ